MVQLRKLGIVMACAALAYSGCGGGSSSSSSTSPATPTTPTTPTTPSGPAPSAPKIVLSRPTDGSITASVNVDAGTEVYLEYGTAPGTYASQSVHANGSANGPVLISVTGLAVDTQYYFRARYRGQSESTFRTDTEHTFHTKRLSGNAFTFVIQADPHMDGNSSGTVYAQTLANELADKPDFMVDLGDTSMVEKCAINGAELCTSPSPATQDTIAARYKMMRGYFEQVCHSLPLLMVLGNHDGETGWPDPNVASLTTWSLAARRTYFANPEPDAFYTGSQDQVTGIGLRQNYYAFEWGNVLIVMLDPYTYTSPKPSSNGWGWTLGATQYQWLSNTLASSRAKFKFVFSHHLLGGNGSEARGGAAFGQFFEWGGRNLDGTWAFDKQRPGWAVPIRQLLIDNKVTAWFHGHDHLYAQEQLDGIIYQEVPQPSLARYDTPDPGAGYGYVGTNGVNIFPSSGHLRLTVSATDVRVEYVRSVPSADETTTRKNGTIVASYVLR